MRKTLIALTAAAPFVFSVSAFATEPSLPPAQKAKVEAKAELAPEVAKPAPKTDLTKTDIEPAKGAAKVEAKGDEAKALPGKGEHKADAVKTESLKTGTVKAGIKTMPRKVEATKAGALKAEPKMEPVKAAPAKAESKVEEVKTEPMKAIPAKPDSKLEVAPAAKP